MTSNGKILIVDDDADLRQALLHGGQSAGETSSHAGHVYGRPLQLACSHRYQGGVDHHGRNGRYRGVRGIGPNGLRAHRHDLSRRVRTLQRGEVDAPDGQVERPQLGFALDRPLGQRGRPLLQAHGVDGPRPGHKARRLCGCESERTEDDNHGIGEAWRQDNGFVFFTKCS